jgi:hypothetical protein
VNGLRGLSVFHAHVIDVIRDRPGDPLIPFLAFAQRLLRYFLGGNVFVSAQDAADIAVQIPKGNLAGPQPDAPAVGLGLRFFVTDLLPAGIDDRTIIGPVQIRLFRPAHLMIVPPDDLRRFGKTGVAGEGPVAPQKNGIAVLPKHPHGYCVENRFQHPAGFPQGVLGLFMVADVAGGRIDPFSPQNVFPLQPPVSAVLGTDPDGKRLHAFLPFDCPEGLQGGGLIFRVDELDKVLAFHLVGRIPQDRFPLRIEFLENRIPVADAQQIQRRIEEGA